MTLIRGEDINIGVGIENPAARGTYVAPQAYVSGRTPTGIKVEVVKTLLAETKASGIRSRGSDIIQRRASGPLEFNVRTETLGYFLKSLLGKCTTSVVSGSIKDHLFEVVASNPQYPTLSIVLAQTGGQDYKFKGSLVKSLELRTPTDDLVNATVQFISIDEEEVATLTPAFSDTDYRLRPWECEIKFAADLAGLGAASAVNLKDFALSIENNARPQQHIGSITPTDNVVGLIEIGGDVTLDYNDDTYHDLYKDGTYKAMQIKATRTDIDLGGGLHPTITIQLAKISLETYDPDRPLDDIVKDKFKIVGHFSDDDAEAINIVIRNTVADYNYDAVS